MAGGYRPPWPSREVRSLKSCSRCRSRGRISAKGHGGITFALFVCNRARDARIPPRQQKQTKVLARSSIWLSNQSRDLLIRSFQLTYLPGDCKAWRPAASLQQTRSTFGNKEMCHVEILHCSRVGLADCDPDAHPDCKRSPLFAGEFSVRRQ